MTCKDCIHSEVCGYRIDIEIQHIERICMHFIIKRKTDCDERFGKWLKEIERELEGGTE